MGLPKFHSDKESAGDARDPSLIPGSGRSLGQEMATHSSILAREIPWTEESGELQSMESQRVGHSWPHTHKHTWIFPPWICGQPFM